MIVINRVVARAKTNAANTSYFLEWEETEVIYQDALTRQRFIHSQNGRNYAALRRKVRKLIRGCLNESN